MMRENAKNLPEYRSKGGPLAETLRKTGTYEEELYACRFWGRLLNKEVMEWKTV